MKLSKVTILLLLLLLAACKPANEKQTGATQTAIFETEVADLVTDLMATEAGLQLEGTITPETDEEALPTSDQYGSTDSSLIPVTITPSMLSQPPTHTPTPLQNQDNNVLCGNNPCPTIDPNDGVCGPNPCPTAGPGDDICGEGPCPTAASADDICGGQPCPTVDPNDGVCGPNPCPTAGPGDDICGGQPCPTVDPSETTP